LASVVVWQMQQPNLQGETPNRLIVRLWVFSVEILSYLLFACFLRPRPESRYLTFVLINGSVFSYLPGPWTELGWSQYAWVLHFRLSCFFSRWLGLHLKVNVLKVCLTNGCDEVCGFQAVIDLLFEECFCGKLSHQGMCGSVFGSMKLVISRRLMTTPFVLSKHILSEK